MDRRVASLMWLCVLGGIAALVAIGLWQTSGADPMLWKNERSPSGIMGTECKLIAVVPAVPRQRRVYDPNVRRLVVEGRGDDIVRRERPDLVLMDIKMPVLDGFKATERLKSNPELAEIPVVALTASVMRESEGEIRELFDGFLRKPVQREHLVSELASLLPHDTKEAEAEVDEEEVAEAAPEWSVEALDDVARSRLPELMTALEGEVQSAWEEASRTLIVNDVEALGARASELGGEFEFEPLREWGERLGVQASTFQMDVMPQTLDEFPQLVTQLREVVPSAHGADESKT